MMSLQSKLRQVATLFGNLTTNAYHYQRVVDKDEYLIWYESEESGSISADNVKKEQSITCYVDVFTKTEFSALLDNVQTCLCNNFSSWALVSVQFEDATGYIHYNWSFEIDG